eukprot:3597572-Amphidinium_carterae.1
MEVTSPKAAKDESSAEAVKRHLAFAHLLTAVQQAADGTVRRPSSCTAGERLLQVVQRVVAENKREMVSNRLQWIAFAFTCPGMPGTADGSVATPLGIIHAVED